MRFNCNMCKWESHFGFLCTCTITPKLLAMVQTSKCTLCVHEIKMYTFRFVRAPECVKCPKWFGHLEFQMCNVCCNLTMWNDLLNLMPKMVFNFCSNECHKWFWHLGWAVKWNQNVHFSICSCTRMFEMPKMVWTFGIYVQMKCKC